VTHTYRDAKVLDSWAPQRADVVSGLAAVLILAWLFMVGLKRACRSVYGRRGWSR
jgi:hypothetical protein